MQTRRLRRHPCSRLNNSRQHDTRAVHPGKMEGQCLLKYNSCDARVSSDGTVKWNLFAATEHHHRTSANTATDTHQAAHSLLRGYTSHTFEHAIEVVLTSKHARRVHLRYSPKPLTPQGSATRHNFVRGARTTSLRRAHRS